MIVSSRKSESFVTITNSCALANSQISKSEYAQKPANATCVDPEKLSWKGGSFSKTTLQI